MKTHTLPSLSSDFKTSFVLEPDDGNSSIFILEFRLDGTEEDRSTMAKLGADMSITTRPAPLGFRAINNGDVLGSGHGNSSNLQGPMAGPCAHQSVRLSAMRWPYSFDSLEDPLAPSLAPSVNLFYSPRQRLTITIVCFCSLLLVTFKFSSISLV